ncbi:hypothetical protein C0V75_15840 [Tabrizicola sp. TH137]|uniref:hypothetical protein n=1 Tax=Tabrizicola sp. TH137 TaxID=2067452 RepID=UPI000C7D5BA1|nr:hypothetical protein [Tabrizicola sp. TH137]PLL11497.1 hypothetical protein C0V75_15840 [Tabrizicola sp. TH137]
MTAFLTILAIGIFGLLIAGVSHIGISRERKALLDARARLAEEAAKAAGPKGASGRDLPLSALVRTGGRATQAAPKHYRRVRGK